MSIFFKKNLDDLMKRPLKRSNVFEDYANYKWYQKYFCF